MGPSDRCGTEPIGVSGQTWDEAIDGDRSNDFAAPTDLGVLVTGSNTVSGETDPGDIIEFVDGDPYFSNLDVDLWTVTVPEGRILDRVNLTAFTAMATEFLGGALGTGAWFAIEAGTEITDPTSPAALTGGTVVGLLTGVQPGDDVLEELGAGDWVPNTFSGSLPAGAYTFWIQEGPTESTYTFDLQVSPIPEPSTVHLSLLGLGVLVLSQARRRRKP